MPLTPPEPDSQVISTGAAEPAPIEPPTLATSKAILIKRAGDLITKWNSIDVITTNQRELRSLNIDHARAVAMGLIMTSETFIGMRVADDNIMRELPVAIKHLESSVRQIIFKPIAPFPGFNAAILEEEFTTYCRYDDWRTPHYQTVDEAATLGWAAVEVIASQRNAAGLENEFIEHQDLIFNTQARRSLQDCDLVIRRYRIANYELAPLGAKHGGFAAEAMEKILGRGDPSNQTDRDISVYKLFFRAPSGTVMCAWYATEAGNILLKEPYQHTSGKFAIDKTAVPATAYPFFILKYRITGNTKITATEGRVDLDRYSQEAQTRLVTSWTNAARRASELYPSLKNPGSARGETEIVLQPGVIANTALDFYTLPFPDASALRGIDYLNGRATQSAGQVDFAAQNRQDSRKTATEIQASSAQASEISGISLFTLSEYQLGVYAYWWDIVSYNALTGNNTFLSTMDPVPRNMYLTARYNLQPAGDIDYVERMNKLIRLQQLAPLFQNTPLYTELLKLIVSLSFPAEAAEFNAKLVDTTSQLSASLVALLAQLPQEQLLQLVPAEAQQQFKQILDENYRAIQVGPNATSPGAAAAGGESAVPGAGGLDQAGASPSGGANAGAQPIGLDAAPTS